MKGDMRKTAVKANQAQLLKALSSITNLVVLYKEEVGEAGALQVRANLQSMKVAIMEAISKQEDRPSYRPNTKLSDPDSIWSTLRKDMKEDRLSIRPDFQEQFLLTPKGESRG